MNKRVLLLGVCLQMFLAKQGLADQLQILKDGDYIAYAQYTIGPVRGRTDRYGRLTLSLPNGTYKGNVEFRGRKYSIDVRITGARGLRKISVNPQ